MTSGSQVLATAKGKQKPGLCVRVGSSLHSVSKKPDLGRETASSHLICSEGGIQERIDAYIPQACRSHIPPSQLHSQALRHRQAQPGNTWAPHLLTWAGQTKSKQEAIKRQASTKKNAWQILLRRLSGCLFFFLIASHFSRKKNFITKDLAPWNKPRHVPMSRVSFSKCGGFSQVNWSFSPQDDLVLPRMMRSHRAVSDHPSSFSK